jgi:hypothetical protein
MGRGPFGVMKLYKPPCGSVRQPGHGPTRPNDRLGPESIFVVGGSADRSIGVAATAGAIIRLAAVVNATTWAWVRLTGKVLPGGCPTIYLVRSGCKQTGKASASGGGTASSGVLGWRWMLGVRRGRSLGCVQINAGLPEQRINPAPGTDAALLDEPADGYWGETFKRAIDAIKRDLAAQP